jgi:hypothetical protein
MTDPADADPGATKPPASDGPGRFAPFHLLKVSRTGQKHLAEFP